nr:immunoglobulin light chain junction region [Macaca mulatta]MOW53457.1 immunoglobulin light chain junction region [Macaca mulatta]MOW55871.1 immunoglobulin light chain junction region [Macaca mulatta]
CQQYYGSPYSF